MKKLRSISHALSRIHKCKPFHDGRVCVCVYARAISTYIPFQNGESQTKDITFWVLFSTQHHVYHLSGKYVRIRIYFGCVCFFLLSSSSPHINSNSHTHLLRGLLLSLKTNSAYHIMHADHFAGFMQRRRRTRHEIRRVAKRRNCTARTRDNITHNYIIWNKQAAFFFLFGA